MSHRSTRAVRVALFALLATLAAAAAGAGPAMARIRSSHSVSEPRVRVQSAAPLPSGTDVGSTVAAGAPVSVTVALAPRDPAALAAYAAAVSDPSSPSFRQYLSVAQFAQRFGATSADATAVSDALVASGLTVGARSSNGLSLSASGTSSEVSAAFDTSLHHVSLADGTTAYADTRAPTLPASAADSVQAVVGLSTIPVAAPAGLVHRRVVPHVGRAIRPRRSRAAVARVSHAALAAEDASSLSATGAPQDCSAADGLTTEDGSGFAYNAQQIASAYGLNSLWNASDFGSGVTVGLFELEPYTPIDQTDVGRYQLCYGTQTVVTPVSENDPASCGTGPNPCGQETVLDIEDIIGLAPDANINVYQGANTDEGVLATYASMIDSDEPPPNQPNVRMPQVISISWGACEPLATQLAAENTLFQEATTQGQTVFAASGDTGADGCGDGQSQQIEDPASQPFVTGVGGTSLPADQTGAPEASQETVWNSTWNNGADGGASGGGVSQRWTEPDYQSQAGIAQSTTSIQCGDVITCREVPDVSADADLNTGYAIYWGVSSDPNSNDPGWYIFGGTSAAAPTWAALAALADASGGSSACTPSSLAQFGLGFVNPLLYSLYSSASSYASGFNDVESGDNAFDDVAGFIAGTGYDPVSGLGAPNASTTLVSDLCAAAAAASSTSSTTTSPTGPSTPPTTSSTPTVTTTTTLTTRTITGTITIPPTTTPTTTTPHHPTAAAITYTVRKRRRTRVGNRVHIRLRAHSRLGLKLHYSAHHLPPGLRIWRHSGTVVGRPRRRGRFRSSITATDTRHDSQTVVVRWTVARKARHTPRHRHHPTAHGSTHQTK